MYCKAVAGYRPTLVRARKAAEDRESDERVGFYYQNELLYWRWRPKSSVEGDVRS